jgi:hypothetical protein
VLIIQWWHNYEGGEACSSTDGDAINKVNEIEIDGIDMAMFSRQLMVMEWKGRLGGQGRHSQEKRGNRRGSID